ncbi:MAG: hemolysin E [Acidovorax sp.]|uniref:hemolysin E n=1 Tax=Acidovorax sp. TaxID=1872122 RepID=UPI00261DE370|nr:hemolysin E [Acidovorax sp.]MDH4418952.1 hemolysin E [Acidovorax sp.]
MQDISETTITPEQAVDLIDKSIDAADKALDLFNKAIDQIIPWNSFEETLTQLDKYRSDYSKEAATLVGEIQTLLLNAQNHYKKAVTSVYGWCDVTIDLIALYEDSLYNPETADMQKEILLMVLGEGQTLIGEGLESLNRCSLSFNSASGKLTELDTRLSFDFDEKSDYFESQVSKIRKEAYAGSAAGAVGGPFGLIIAYAIAAGVVEGKLIPELRKKFVSIEGFFKDIRAMIVGAQDNIATTKNQLEQEMFVLTDLRSEITKTKTIIEVDKHGKLKDKILARTESLSKKCSEYVARHAKKPLTSASIKWINAHQYIADLSSISRQILTEKQ